MSAGAAIPEALESEPHHNRPDARKGSSKSKKTPYLLLMPGVLWLAVFFIVPMLFLVQTSLQKGTPDTGYIFGLGNWTNYTSSLQEYDSQFIRSFVYAGIATLLCLVVGYPLAYAIAFRSGKWKGALLILVIAPFFTSFIIRTLAWKTLLADDGLIVELRQLEPPEQPLRARRPHHRRPHPGDTARHDHRPHVQLPARSWCCRCTRRWSASTTASSRPQGISTAARSPPSARSPGRCRCQGSSRGRS